MLATKATPEWRVPTQLEEVIDYCKLDEPASPRKIVEPAYLRDSAMRLEAARLSAVSYSAPPLTWTFALRSGLYHSSGLAKRRICMVLSEHPDSLAGTLNAIQPYILDPNLTEYHNGRRNEFADEWGLTRKEFCDAIGISTTTLRNYEKGRNVQTRPLLDMIFVNGTYPTEILKALADKRYERIVRREATYRRYLMGD